MFDIANLASWLQFVVLLVSVIAIGIKVGNFTGKQEQINTTQDKFNESFSKNIDDLDDKINETEKTLGCKIDKIGKDVDFIRGKIDAWELSK